MSRNQHKLAGAPAASMHWTSACKQQTYTSCNTWALVAKGYGRCYLGNCMDKRLDVTTTGYVHGLCNYLDDKGHTLLLHSK